MEKNLYSLILIDEVVAKVDELAHTRGTSRSNLINEILAEYVSYLTPQKRIASIFDVITSTVQPSGIVRWGEPSASILVLKSVLNYRYNPTIRYSIELTMEDTGCIWDFKVKSRSQSDSLVSRLTVFFELWNQLELSMHPNGPRYLLQGGGLHRTGGIRQEFADSQKVGEALGDYLIMFDKAMKISFSAKHGIDMQTYEAITGLYSDYLDRHHIII